ncbi:hypothetical protein GCM10010406_44590 [Streptomyces thermolineatus]|uniref:CsbD-like domain-containing protein n=2 Tax=Streptomyces TaxID=1883 RepID=A0ABP5ZRJ3_9ACTN
MRRVFACASLVGPEQPSPQGVIMGIGDQFKHKAQEMAEEAKRRMAERKGEHKGTSRGTEGEGQEGMQGKMQDLREEGEKRTDEGRERFER